MTNLIQLKVSAHREWANYLERGDQLRNTFVRAGLPIPEELKLLLGGPSSHTVAAAQPFRPTGPPEAQADWIWIDITSATTTSLMLAIIRRARKPLDPKEVRDEFIAIGGAHSEVVVGTLYNSASRLAANGVVARGDDGTVAITQMERAPVLFEERLWGPVIAFQMAELAAHRRDAAVYILRKHGPMQQMQLLAKFRELDLLNTGVPLNKDLIKGDFEVMAGKRVRRLMGSKKWEAL